MKTFGSRLIVAIIRVLRKCSARPAEIAIALSSRRRRRRPMAATSSLIVVIDSLASQVRDAPRPKPPPSRGHSPLLPPSTISSSTAPPPPPPNPPVPSSPRNTSSPPAAPGRPRPNKGQMRPEFVGSDELVRIWLQMHREICWLVQIIAIWLRSPSTNSSWSQFAVVTEPILVRTVNRPQVFRACTSCNYVLQ
ncbi:hypothetical protein SEVIR_1G327633v4 [Setaria viridis]